jgi:hypothetical protein
VADQLFWLFVLALPTSCVAWTVTHEELFREVREWLTRRSESSRSWWSRKFFFMWTCDYCLSHYVAAAVVAIMNFQLLLTDWRGYAVAWLSLTAVANLYLGVFAHLRVEIGKDRAEMKQAELRNKKAG